MNAMHPCNAMNPCNAMHECDGTMTAMNAMHADAFINFKIVAS